MELVDGELHIFDDHGNVIHVYERDGLSRATYMHVAHWIQKNFKKEKTFQENWDDGNAAWDALTPETQGHLINMSAKEEQCAEDIRLGLLATLAEYRGFQFVKDAFEDAIRCVQI